MFQCRVATDTGHKQRQALLRWTERVDECASVVDDLETATDLELDGSSSTTHSFFPLSDLLTNAQVSDGERRECWRPLTPRA